MVASDHVENREDQDQGQSLAFAMRRLLAERFATASLAHVIPSGALPAIVKPCVRRDAMIYAPYSCISADALISVDAPTTFRSISTPAITFVPAMSPEASPHHEVGFTGPMRYLPWARLGSGGEFR